MKDFFKSVLLTFIFYTRMNYIEKTQGKNTSILLFIQLFLIGIYTVRIKQNYC